MNLNNLSLSALLNEENLKFFDTLENKLNNVKRTIQILAGEAENFTDGVSTDDPKKRIAELKKQREEAMAEMNSLMEDWLFSEGMNALSKMGEPGKFSAIMMTFIKKSMSGNLESRDMGYDFHNRDATKVAEKKPFILPNYEESEYPDLENINLFDPRWKNYFQKQYKQWQEYNKKYPIKKNAKEGEDVFSIETLLSIVGYLSEEFGAWLDLYDTGKNTYKAFELDSKIKNIDEELQKLEEEEKFEKNKGNSNPSGTPKQRINDNEGAGFEDNGRDSAHNAVRKYFAKDANLPDIGKKPLAQINPNIKNDASEGKQGKSPDPLETFAGVFGQVQKVGGALSTIMNTLHIGADTFVGKVINGFNSALSVIQSIMDVLQAAQTIGSFLKIVGLASGGHVPGVGDTDSVPAMLTPGEYVIKKSVVNKFGSGFFEWINGGGLTNSLAGHYAGGGIVAAGGRQMVAVSIPDVKIKGSDLYLSWRRENITQSRRSI